ncbi:MAG: ATP-dependent Clp protease proteolytic subunit [Candidatus Lloydbacteria bacterium]|nr:ATP-dependent Clp protease proteolytic subunit [Candidatus Lloydbacteria bacterium]
MLTGDITEKKIGDIKGSLAELSMTSPEENILLFINSKGGDAEPGIALYDFITLFLKAPVVGIVGAECDSTALFILLGCIKRVAALHSTFLIHPVRSENVRIIYGNAIDNQMKFIKKTLAEYFQKGNKILEKHSKMSLSEIERLSFANKESGTILSPQEALKKGLIDEIAKGDKYKIF